MIDLECERVSDLLPDYVGGRLTGDAVAAVRSHLAGCADCDAEARALRALLADRVAAPAGLHAGVVAAALARRPRRRRILRPRSLVLAASVAAALLLARQLVESPDGSGSETESPDTTVASADDPLWTDNLEPPYSGFPGVDGVVAGGVLLDDLSVEQLEALLEETS